MNCFSSSGRAGQRRNPLKKPLNKKQTAFSRVWKHIQFEIGAMCLDYRIKSGPEEIDL